MGDNINWEPIQQSPESSGSIIKIVAGTLALIPSPFFASIPLAALQGSTVEKTVSDGLCGLMERTNFPVLLSDTCYSLATLLPNTNAQSKVIGGIVLTTICLAFSATMITLGIRGLINPKKFDNNLQ